MSSTEQPSPRETSPTGPTGDGQPQAGAGAGRSGSERPVRDQDPLRGSRTSGIWAATIVLIVLLILLAVFILQNTQDVEVTYFAWNGRAPLSATLLIATAGGALAVASAGALRILQLRRRVKKDRKRR